MTRIAELVLHCLAIVGVNGQKRLLENTIVSDLKSIYCVYQMARGVMTLRTRYKSSMQRLYSGPKETSCA